jgi:hypothetical protein
LARHSGGSRRRLYASANPLARGVLLPFTARGHHPHNAIPKYTDLYEDGHDIATCIYFVGIDPFTKKQVYVVKGLRDRKMQRALMQFFKKATA